MPTKLLILNCSGRVTRSISRQLTTYLSESCAARDSETTVTSFDLGLKPPATVNETWIQAAFSDPHARTDAMNQALAQSDRFISEIESADAIVIGTPIYNFGMPAQLKAFFDQIVRVGRTFDFDPGAPMPYRALLRSKPVVVVEAAGDGSMFPGGELAHLNFLEPHVATILGFIGLTEVSFIRVGYEEFQDERHRASLTAARAAIDEWVRSIAQCPLGT